MQGGLGGCSHPSKIKYLMSVSVRFGIYLASNVVALKPCTKLRKPFCLGQRSYCRGITGAGSESKRRRTFGGPSPPRAASPPTGAERCFGAPTVVSRGSPPDFLNSDWSLGQDVGKY